MLFYHKGIRGRKAPLPFVACARKTVILRGQIWSVHESDVVGLVAGAAAQRLLDALLDACRQCKWLKVRGRQRTDSTHVLARVRAVNRLEGIGETLRAALNTLAVVAPEWVQEHCPADWVQRYGHRVDDYHLPTNKHERHAYAHVIGMDGHALLLKIDTLWSQHL